MTNTEMVVVGGTLGLLLMLSRSIHRTLVEAHPDAPRSTVDLWIAQGFGVGLIPVAPGTFGSVVGVLWFLLLAASGQLWVLAAGSLAGLALSVWLCGAAEKQLGQTDPGSVVLDEIAAIPVCFFAWILLRGSMPEPHEFVTGSHWTLTVAVFVAFRFFDVVKPWPVRQSQRLPGGWGITLDDLLAAVYVNFVVLVVHAAWVWRHGQG